MGVEETEGNAHPLNLDVFVGLERNRSGDADQAVEGGEEEAKQIYHKLLFDAVNERLENLVISGDDDGPRPPLRFRRQHGRLAQRVKLADVARARNSTSSGVQVTTGGLIDPEQMRDKDRLAEGLLRTITRWDRLEDDPRATRALGSRPTGTTLGSVGGLGLSVHSLLDPAPLRAPADGTFVRGGIASHPLSEAERMEAVVRAEVELEEPEWLDWEAEEARCVRALEKMVLEGLLEDTAKQVLEVMAKREARRGGARGGQGRREE